MEVAWNIWLFIFYCSFLLFFSLYLFFFSFSNLARICYPSNCYISLLYFVLVLSPPFLPSLRRARVFFLLFLFSISYSPLPFPLHIHILFFTFSLWFGFFFFLFCVCVEDVEVVQRQRISQCIYVQRVNTYNIVNGSRARYYSPRRGSTSDDRRSGGGSEQHRRAALYV